MNEDDTQKSEKYVQYDVLCVSLNNMHKSQQYTTWCML